MITHIQMKNFKSWQDSGKVDLAPLTGFFGTNSSGKCDESHYYEPTLKFKMDRALGTLEAKQWVSEK